MVSMSFCASGTECIAPEATPAQGSARRPRGTAPPNVCSARHGHDVWATGAPTNTPPPDHRCHPGLDVLQ